ncbi:hypothetical protein ACOSQ2_006697 [Xanthoceras sorbifolium]
MVSAKEDKSLIRNIRLSSVGPGNATGSDVIHEPSGMDLAMKLHYLIGVYLFKKHAVEGFSTKVIKESMFYLLNEYYVTCGRFRRPDSGRPYMKCNDCGVRFVEAECEKTVDEWVEMRDYSLNKHLVYHLPIGPELSFSPSVYLQITRFKCGGMSLGLSWAHVLGDAQSACDFVNTWGQVISKIQSHGPPYLPRPIPPPSPIEKPESQLAHAKTEYPLSIHRVDPVGDHWVTANNFEMDTLSFHLTAAQITHLQSKHDQAIPVFEFLAAVIWKCIAKIRDAAEAESTKIVTLCKTDPDNPRTGKLSNSQILSTVEADFSISNADLEKLAKLLAEEGIDERGQIERAVEDDGGASDYVVYGGNLTFVNLEEVDSYGVEVNGNKAELVWCGIEGVADKGAVVVTKDSGGKGRLVTVILPEHEVVKLKPELKNNGLLLDTDID